MLFNSFNFAVFFPIVWVFYWVLPFRVQNLFLLVASYVFYGLWDWRFLSLIAISTIVDYVSGLKIYSYSLDDDKQADRRRKLWMTASVFTNLGILGFFKYFNFFVDSLEGLVSAFGIQPQILHLNIVLPVGISFYTFQTMSYTIDIYRGKMEPTRRFFDFALYVSFFPQLVAGPIERAKALLPRISNKRVFDKSQICEGLHLILLGLFKKVYVADNLAPFIDRVFSTGNPTGWEVLFGGWGFAIQVYGDFSGYSDIARGCAKCLGIELMVNFNHPYVAINPIERWRRWHISLSSWLRDYLYITLGGSRHGTVKTYRNLSLTMILGGLWHGAGWNFVFWGAWEGLLIVAHRLISPVLDKINFFRANIPDFIRQVFKILLMFQLVSIGLIIFRGHNLSHIGKMLNTLIGFQGVYGAVSLSLFVPLLKFGAPLFLFEKIQYAVSRDQWQHIESVPLYLRSVFYGILFYLVTFYGAAAQSFIYFQF